MRERTDRPRGGDHGFEELVARQAGVVSLAQAAAHGYSGDRVRRRVREGRWHRLHPGVVLVGGNRLTDEVRLHPGVVLVGGNRLTDEVRLRAAALWAGERAVVAGPAAAHWHGMLARAPAVVDVTATARRPWVGC